MNRETQVWHLKLKRFDHEQRSLPKYKQQVIVPRLINFFQLEKQVINVWCWGWWAKSKSFMNQTISNQHTF